MKDRTPQIPRTLLVLTPPITIDGKIWSLWVIIAPSSNFHARLVESYVAPKRKTRLVDKA
ncbi:hypothetical protein X751_05585 [Mesorhizobium sp. LNJC395A00]|nr:hypothetical protein X752_02930 [Mesorhizobium sp. LNJC398B00]ESY22379.1 hypothetical protein X751_05585 [Mesorhizobium sp. LNJC395A00]